MKVVMKDSYVTADSIKPAECFVLDGRKWMRVLTGKRGSIIDSSSEHISAVELETGAVINLVRSLMVIPVNMECKEV